MDCLAACTRKGSVLPMQLDSIGLLSKEASTVRNIVAETQQNEKAGPDLSCCPIYCYGNFKRNVFENVRWNE